MKKKYNYIYSIKFIAVLLVLNSHLDKMYPIPALATGGAIGNTLFFLTSGYTWTNIREDFKQWYGKKIKNIWFPTLITNCFYLIIFEQLSEFSLIKFVQIFIYPNKSWFCGAILLYGAIYYFMVKSKKEKYTWIALIILVIVDVTYYILKIDKTFFSIESFKDGGLCRFSYYFICMLFGYLYRKNEDKLSKRKSFFGIGAIIVFFTMYIFK